MEIVAYPKNLSTFNFWLRTALVLGATVGILISTFLDNLYFAYYIWTSTVGQGEYDPEIAMHYYKSSEQAFVAVLFFVLVCLASSAGLLSGTILLARRLMEA
jgi:hypothetical protein